jgi:quinol monooxygenase YgiN
MPEILTMIASFQAKPGQERRLQDELNAMAEPSLAEPGCAGYRPLVDASRQGAMVIIEQWRGRDALEVHFATPHFRHVAKVLDEILVEPFGATMLTELPGEQAS